MRLWWSWAHGMRGRATGPICLCLSPPAPASPSCPQPPGWSDWALSRARSLGFLSSGGFFVSPLPTKVAGGGRAKSIMGREKSLCPQGNVSLAQPHILGGGFGGGVGCPADIREDRVGWGRRWCWGSWAWGSKQASWRGGCLGALAENPARWSPAWDAGVAPPGLASDSAPPCANPTYPSRLCSVSAGHHATCPSAHWHQAWLWRSFSCLDFLGCWLGVPSFHRGGN